MWYPGWNNQQIGVKAVSCVSWILQLLFFLIVLSSDKFVTASGGQIVTHIFK